MTEWQKRVVEEKLELDDKTCKLTAFIFSSAFEEELSVEDQNLLLRQREIMIEYSDQLMLRIERFTDD